MNSIPILVSCIPTRLTRGKGVNKMIVETLIQWSVSRNITELRLEVYYLNEAAIRAYEKTGFKKHLIEMRMGID